MDHGADAREGTGGTVNRCAVSLLKAMEKANGLKYAAPGPMLVKAQSAIGSLVDQGATEKRLKVAIGNIASGVWRTKITDPQYFVRDFPKIEAAGRTQETADDAAERIAAGLREKSRGDDPDRARREAEYDRQEAELAAKEKAAAGSKPA